MIERTLVLLGLKDKEVEVYLALMRLGKATPAQIAQITTVNRATVYSVANILLKKGLIQEDLVGSSRQLVALPPQDLVVLIEKESKRLQRKEELVMQAITELNDLPLNTQYAVPQIRFIEENNIDLQTEAEKWDKSILKVDSTKTWWGFQDISFVGHYDQWIDWYWSRANPDIQLKLLTNDGRLETEIKKRNLEKREMKFVSKETTFTATTWVLGDYLVMLYTKDKPFYMIEINNPTLSHNYRELFKTIWEKY